MSKDKLIISHTSIQQFKKCNRCWWFDKNQKIKPPVIYPLTLNNMMDINMKQFFSDSTSVDFFQSKGGLLDDMPNVMPCTDARLEKWCSAFKGVVVQNDNHTLKAVIDGLFETRTDSKVIYIITEFKSRSRKESTKQLVGYDKIFREQLEFYYYVLTKYFANIKENIILSNRGILIIANGLQGDYTNTQPDKINVAFKFETLSLKLKTDWIPFQIEKMLRVYNSDFIPERNINCSMCDYVKDRVEFVKDYMKGKKQ